MQKGILLSLFGTVLAVAILIAVDSNKSIHLSTNGFVLENAVALADGECGDGKVVGSPMSGTCNQPMSTTNKTKCSTSTITCQGSSSCCERKVCSIHT